MGSGEGAYNFRDKQPAVDELLQAAGVTTLMVAQHGKAAVIDVLIRLENLFRSSLCAV